MLLSINCSLCNSAEAQILHTFKQSDLVDMFAYFISLPRSDTIYTGNLFYCVSIVVMLLVQ